MTTLRPGQASTDRIEQRILLRASRSRVWRALTDVREFNAWFGVALTGELTPGAHLRGGVTDERYSHLIMDIVVDRVEPERLFSWRWHPGETHPDVDYSSEPTTLVVFELEAVEGGTLLTVVETGFDQIPPSRRADAFRDNARGWAEQVEAIDRYLRSAA